jgi:hypothetical protein
MFNLKTSTQIISKKDNIKVWLTCILSLKFHKIFSNKIMYF